MNEKFKKLIFTGFAFALMGIAIINPMNMFAANTKTKYVIVKNDIAQIKITATATFHPSETMTSRMWSSTKPVGTLYSGTGSNVYVISNGIENQRVGTEWIGNLGVQGVCSTNGMSFYSNNTIIKWYYDTSNTSKGVY